MQFGLAAIDIADGPLLASWPRPLGERILST
jgi:hypothetical protein